jgi:8-oxo-dGTP pyrophosphatase MutT (NUDIX family)
MSHIHTAPNQHDLTVSGYIIRLDTAEPEIMLHKHRVLGRVMQFGGHVELDESPWEAIARELKEEVGYDFDQLQVLQPHERMITLPGTTILLPQPVCVFDATYGATVAPDHFHDDLSWAFVTRFPPRHELATDESHDIRSLSRSKLIAVPDEEIFEDVRQIALFIFDTCLPKWETVPALPLSR